MRWKGQPDVSEKDIFSIRMPPVVRVNVVFLGQRCADELILGMSRGAWRQRARVHHRWGEEGEEGGDLEHFFFFLLHRLGNPEKSS